MAIAKKVFNKEKFTVVGTPTITDDGIASGFSSSNYLSDITTLSSYTSNNFEINECVTFGDTTDVNSMLTISDNNRERVQLAIGNSTTGIFSVWNSDGTRILYILIPNIALGVKLFIKFGRNYSGYYFKYSYDGLTYITGAENVDAEIFNFNYIQLGTRKANRGHYFKGSIDLKQFSITVCGVEVFSGSKWVIDESKLPKEKKLDYEALKKELVKYYQNLLIIQYHDKPKAKALIKAQIEETLANLLELRVRDAFDVDTAVGVQLDIIGKWVGVDRYYTGQAPVVGTFFAMPSWNDAIDDTKEHGFSTYNTYDADVGDGIFNYSFIISLTNRVGDEDYRYLIKLKIIKNNVSHSPKPIDDALYDLFGDTLYTTWNECMEMTFHYNQSRYSIIQLGREKNCFPIPTGVEAIFEEV